MSASTYDPNNVENLVNLVSEQAKEIKVTKRRLEKLEEKYVKTNTDLKNCSNDKSNYENFIKTIFPKDLYENVIKAEYGLVDTNELSKLWIVVESKSGNEFQKILQNYRNENADLSEKLKLNKAELEKANAEFNNYKKDNESNFEKLNYFSNNFNDLSNKNEQLETEKSYLLKILDEKTQQIDNLNALEIENAELKAKSLLDNLNNSNINNSNNISTSNNTNNIFVNLNNVTNNNNIANESNQIKKTNSLQDANEKTLKISKFNIKIIFYFFFLFCS